MGGWVGEWADDWAGNRKSIMGRAAAADSCAEMDWARNRDSILGRGTGADFLRRNISWAATAADSYAEIEFWQQRRPILMRKSILGSIGDPFLCYAVEDTKKHSWVLHRLFFLLIWPLGRACVHACVPQSVC